MNIKERILPGDVLGISKPDNEPLFFKVTDKIIVLFQRMLFHGGFNEDFHSMLYFDDEHIFSMEPPKAKYRKLDEFNNEEILSVYRYVNFELGNNEILQLRNYADEFIGQEYDIGELIDIAEMELLGKPYEYQNLFGITGYNVVCSVAVGKIFNKLLLKKGCYKLFQNIQEENFNPAFFDGEYKGEWSEYCYYPCMFANSQTHFENEFGTIGRFKKFEEVKDYG